MADGLTRDSDLDGRLGRAPVLVLGGLAACAFYLALEWAASGRLGLPLDDGWIHQTFARSLASGDGMSYQGGRWVSGSTAPLWTALVSLGFLFPGDSVLWAKALGVVCYLSAALAMVRLSAVFGVASGLRWLGAVLFLLTDWMVWSALSGMEVPLFVLLSVWGMELQARESRGGWSSHWALPCFGLASLARPEGVLLLALAIAERLVRFERGPVEPRIGLASSEASARTVLATGVAAASALPFLVFSWLASGSALPTTFEAKLVVGHKWLPALRDLWLAAEVLFRPQPFVFLLAGAGAVALLRRLGRRDSPGLLPLLWVLALPCVYSTMAPAGRPMPVGNFGRYLFPLFPSLILLGVLGAQSLGRVAWRPWSLRGARLPVPLVTLALLLVPAASATLAGASRHARNVANVEQSDVRAGRWIAENLPPTAVLGVQDVGAIAFLAPNPILDLVGIVTPEIRKTRRGRRDMEWLASEVEAGGAAFLVVFPESYGGEAVLRRFFPSLRSLQRFPVRENITMAGSELVVYAIQSPGA